MPSLQDTRNIAIETPLKDSTGGDALLLDRCLGVEELGRLFHFELELSSSSESIAFDKIIGQNVTLRATAPNGSTRYFNGYISQFGQSGSGLYLNSYRGTMVPWLWFLTRMSDCRVFQNKTVPQIIEQVFKNRGYTDFRSTLIGHYRTWEYCVQYRETDFNFVSRLMEQEGIYYYFEHEQGKHTMVMLDFKGSHNPVSGEKSIPFSGQTDESQESISQWHIEQQYSASSYSLRDFDFKSPTKGMDAMELSEQQLDAKFDIFDYPGEYTNRDEGMHYATVRQNDLASTYLVAHGRANAVRLAVGAVFTLTDFPRADQLQDYLVVRAETLMVSSAFSSDSGLNSMDPPFSCRFTAMPSERQFRPPLLTPKPLIQGPQTAIVVGQKESDENSSADDIWPDKYGRVKVQFHWDRYGNKDEDSSAWIRVAQIWAGRNWGGIFIPRVGQEVVVDFLEGDPDEPIIMGSVYNGTNMPPYTLPDNKTQSGIKTRSSRQGGEKNFNEIRFEDKKGSEDLLIHAERTMHNSVEGFQYITVGGNRNIKTGYIDQDGTEHGDVKELVHKNHNLHVLEDLRQKVEGESHMHVQKVATENYDIDFTQSVTGKCVIIADTIQLQGTTKIVLMAGSSSIVIDASGVSVTGTPLINLNSPGPSPSEETAPPLVDPDDPD